MINNALQHLDLLHNATDGYVTIAKKENGTFKQKTLLPSELLRNLDHWQGNDIYISQNSFFIPRRRVDTLRQLRTLYIDLDFYRVLHPYDPQYIVWLLEKDCFRTKIPEPNCITYSGRGLVLQWFIEPTRNFSLPLWQRIQRYFYSILKEYGADPCSLDAARVFRLAGSVNSKNGNLVYLEHRHSERYTLNEIKEEYLPEEVVTRNKRAKFSSSQNRTQKNPHKFSVWTLHRDRMFDLNNLVANRNGDMDGCREQCCYLYRYWNSCYVSDPVEALRQTLDFNSQFLDPLPDSEVVRATKSVENYYKNFISETEFQKARALGYPSAGLNVSNQRIIEMLRITNQEQRFMTTIISKDEKYRRSNKSREAKRRAEGKPTRDEYQASRQEKARVKLEKFRGLLQEMPNASNRDLATLLEVSEGNIRQLKKKL
ncbi:replication protein [Tumebacillus permanentifrigoris]|uniref:Replication protein n=1 Tax=Tumebacillus permanentifrigoris TaxID=378543 RepID=A0A316D5I4_9BACL|nr:replication protein [Tumebacillus permanentifrigoris]PWK08470.1 hypothetical protein C7459_115130 [Tumebacillus permanentifrigoris]